MRHHAQNGFTLVKHSGDIGNRTIGVCAVSNVAIRSAVAERNLVFVFQKLQHIRLNKIISFAMRDRNFNHLMMREGTREISCIVFSAQMNLLADKVKQENFKSVLSAANKYGKVSTQKFFSELFA